MMTRTYRLLSAVNKQLSASTCPAASSDPEDIAKAKPLSQIPGPRPLLGTGFKMALGLEKFRDRSSELHQKYGKLVYERIAPGVAFVRVYDPDDMEFVYRREGEYPLRAALEMVLQYCKERKLPLGLANSKGEDWARLRKAVNKPMLRPRTISAYIPAQEAVAADLVTKIGKILNNNKETENMMEEINLYAIEAVGVVLFDKRLHAMDRNMKSPDEIVDFVKASVGIMRAIQKLILAPPVYKIYKTKIYKQFEQDFEYVIKTTKKHIEEALARNERGEMGDQVDIANNVVLNIFESGLTTHEITMTIVDLFFAGIDTTSNLLGFALNCVAIHKDAQEELYHEIVTQIPSNEPVTEAAVNNLHYLKAFVRETLRLHPIAVLNPRTLDKTITLKGYKIPAGQPMFMQHGVVSSLNQHIEEPEKFLPERWLRKRKDKQDIHPFLSVPFGHGARMCIGRRLAEQEVYLAIIKILQKYKMEYHHEPIENIPGFTNRPDKPLTFKFIERQ